MLTAEEAIAELKRRYPEANYCSAQCALDTKTGRTHYNACASIFNEFNIEKQWAGYGDSFEAAIASLPTDTDQPAPAAMDDGEVTA